MTEITKDMTLDDAAREASNRVYQVAQGIFEVLEAQGHLAGNGHHVAQKLAAAAEEEVRKRWRA